MSIYDTVIPTHATLARAATSPSGSAFAPLRLGVKSPTYAEEPRRKYIIIEQDGTERALVFDCAIQHSQMVPAGANPVSAGFIIMFEGTIGIPKIGSDSLHLEPRDEDWAILKSFLGL
jgi:hypothetical protein